MPTSVTLACNEESPPSGPQESVSDRHREQGWNVFDLRGPNQKVDRVGGPRPIVRLQRDHADLSQISLPPLNRTVNSRPGLDRE